MEPKRRKLAVAIAGLALAACSGGGAGMPQPGNPPQNDPPQSDPGLLQIEDLQYQGAFRLSSATHGDSSTNYSMGKLAYNPDNHSLFIAGHATQKSIAEFAIPTPSMGATVNDLPGGLAPIQAFVSLLDAGPNGNPEDIDRITGLLYRDGQLIINAESLYDGAGDNRDTTLVIRDADNLGGGIDGYFELQGAAHRVRSVLQHG